MLKRIAAISFALAFTANAEDEVSSTKKASFFDQISSQTANVQYRNYYQEDGEGSYSESKAPLITSQVRTNWTWNLYNDNWMNTFTFAVNHSHNDGSQQITQRRPRLWSEVKVVDADYFYFAPYLDVHGPQTGVGTRGDLGLIPKVRVPTIDSKVAAFDLSFRVEAEAQFSGDRETQKTNGQISDEKADQLGLVKNPETGDNEDEGRTDPIYEVTYIPEVGVNLDKVVKGLSFLFYVENETTYTPEFNASEDSEELEKVWKSSTITETYAELYYKLTDKLTFIDSFWTTHGGLYEARHTGEFRVGNLAALSYTLF